MGTTSVQSGQNSGQVPGYQDGGAKTQQELDSMNNDELMKLAKTGNDIDKKNAAAELAERLGSGVEKGGKEQKGKDGGGTKDGGGAGGTKDTGGAGGTKDGGGPLEVDDLKKLLEKYLNGTITPEEEAKLMEALGSANPSAKTPDQNDPEKIGDPAPSSPIPV